MFLKQIVRNDGNWIAYDNKGKTFMDKTKWNDSVYDKVLRNSKSVIQYDLLQSFQTIRYFRSLLSKINKIHLKIMSNEGVAFHQDLTQLSSEFIKRKSWEMTAYSIRTMFRLKNWKSFIGMFWFIYHIPRILQIQIVLSEQFFGVNLNFVDINYCVIQIFEDFLSNIWIIAAAEI